MAEKQGTILAREDAIPRRREAERGRRDFAEAMARAELGRFYFGEAAVAAFEEARRKRPRRRRDV
jgi:hypothetical protein